MRCCRRACCVVTRRSHSRAMAVARWGFEAGMGSGKGAFVGVVVAARMGRVSRWMVWCPSIFLAVVSLKLNEWFVGREMGIL